MVSFKHLPIKWKLKLIIIFTSFVALVFASVAFMLKDLIEMRQTILSDLSSLAQVIGINSVGALLFDDQGLAEKNLAALRAKPHVVLACMYDANGEIFAVYKAKHVAEDIPAPIIREDGRYYKDNHFFVYKSVYRENDLIGKVCIQYNLQGFYIALLQSVAIFTIIIGIAVIITWFISSLLQKIISAPILTLTNIARMVSEKKDFSVRAEKHASDEIGVLIDVFNDMLAAIQSRDETLRVYREHLEEQVFARTSELRKTNKQLKSAKEAAEAANRAKSEFLANMSHEIRTPMNAVLGFTDLLMSLITDTRQKSYLESISSSGKNLLMLINGILDLSKIEAGKMELECEPVNPRTMFSEINHLFSLQASEKKIDFSVVIADDLPSCLILDEVRIRQIMFNLIGNAVKFTDKGRVTVIVEHVPCPDNPAKINLSIAVEDTGIGIPAKYHKEIFDAFKQTDGQSTKRYGGTGLGLSITKRLIEMMGGAISVESEENNGSKFIISIPGVTIASPDCAKKPVASTLNPDEVQFDPAKVLIVDDITSNRILIKEFFRGTQLVPIEAENGLEAIELTKRFRPDVVLMDLRMPVMGGVEALKQIRADEEISATPIIALTASGMKEERDRIIAEGFDSYLRKPIRKSILFQEFTLYLKHFMGGESKEEKPAEIIPAEEISVDPIKLSQTVAELNKTYLPMWCAAKENLFFDDIEKFAAELIGLSNRNGLPLLDQYGNELTRHVQNFDVEKMNAVLDSFPKLVETISALEPKDKKESQRDQRKEPSL